MLRLTGEDLYRYRHPYFYMSEHFEEFTQAQVARQIEKIRAALFDSYQDVGDGTYAGTLDQSVKEIIEGTLVFDEVLSEDDFTAMFTDCTEKLVDWIQENTRGVDRRIVAFFISDFVSQTLLHAYNVQEIDRPYNKDVMFG